MITGIDKAIEHALKDAIEKAGIDITHTDEVALRVSQTEFETGEILWKIDNKPVLKLAIGALSEDVIVFTLQKIKPKPEIIIPEKRIIISN
jgi:hypothetical protein